MLKKLRQWYRKWSARLVPVAPALIDEAADTLERLRRAGAI